MNNQTYNPSCYCMECVQYRGFQSQHIEPTALSNYEHSLSQQNLSPRERTPELWNPNCHCLGCRHITNTRQQALIQTNPHIEPKPTAPIAEQEPDDDDDVVITDMRTGERRFGYQKLLGWTPCVYCGLQPDKNGTWHNMCDDEQDRSHYSKPIFSEPKPKDRMPILWQSAFGAAFVHSQANVNPTYKQWCIDIADAAVLAAEQLAANKGENK